jgi:hypothetical protein
MREKIPEVHLRIFRWADFELGVMNVTPDLSAMLSVGLSFENPRTRLLIRILTIVQ